MQFNFEVSLLIFLSVGLESLSIDESEVLKSLTIIVLGPIFPFMSCSVCFTRLNGLVSVHACLEWLYLLGGLFLFKYVMIFFVSSDQFWLEVSFVRYECSYSYLPLYCIWLEYHSPSFHFQSLYLCQRGDNE